MTVPVPDRNSRQSMRVGVRIHVVWFTSAGRMKTTLRYQTGNFCIELAMRVSERPDRTVQYALELPLALCQFLPLHFWRDFGQRRVGYAVRSNFNEATGT